MSVIDDMRHRFNTLVARVKPRPVEEIVPPDPDAALKALCDTDRAGLVELLVREANEANLAVHASRQIHAEASYHLGREASLRGLISRLRL